jgi:hypothetical protein
LPTSRPLCFCRSERAEVAVSSDLLRRFSAVGSLKRALVLRALVLRADDVRDRVARELEVRERVAREVEDRERVARDVDFLAGGIYDSSARDRDVVRGQAYRSVTTRHRA